MPRERVEQPVARLPRQPHGAGAGGAVHRRLPGVLGAGAQRGQARAAVRAAGRAGPDAARAAAAGAGRIAAARADRQRRRHRAGHRAGRSWRCRLLGGDLGGGYFAGVRAELAMEHAARRCSTARSACWRRASAAGGRRAPRKRCREAQTLKGLGAAPARGGAHRVGAAADRGRRGAGAGAAGRSAFRSRPICRSASCWSAASRRCRWLIAAALRPARAPGCAQRLLPLLAIERARRMRGTAAVAVSGVVASLEPGGGADGDGGELSRFGHALARRGAAGRPLRAQRAPAAARPASRPRSRRPSCRRWRSCPAWRAPARCAPRPLLLDPSRPAVTLIARSLDGDAGALAAAGGRGRCRCRRGRSAST